MAKVANVGTRIWLDQYDLSGFLNTAEQAVTQQLPPVTCLSDTGPRRVVDNYDHSHRHGGFFDGASGTIDQIINALRGSDTDRYLAHLWGASSEGGIVYESIVKLSEDPRRGGAGGAVLLDAVFQGANGMSRGVIIRNGTITADGNGTGRNVGATAAGQVFQTVIRVFSGTFTGFTVKLQESSDDGSGDAYEDIATLSQAVTEAGVWRLTTTGATEAWKRVVIVDWDGTSALVAVTAGYVQGT